MRTITLRTLAGRAVATLGALLALAAAVPVLAADALSTPITAEAPKAVETPKAVAAPIVVETPKAVAAPIAVEAPKTADAPEATADQIFEAKVDAGYRVTDVKDNRSLLFPYDPLNSGPILGLDLLYLTPQIGALKLEAGFIDADAWQADLGYNHGSDVRLQVGTQAYTHARDHVAPVSSTALPVDGKDEDPGRTYRDERQDSTASMKVRIPGYPAHLTASAGIDKHGGEQQMQIFYRGCATDTCHQNSRTRELDEETRRYTVGLDAHVGPVDLAYSHATQTYRDNAADPIVASPGMPPYVGGLPAGNYPYDVNPDLRSAADQLTLNTNLTNRMVLSLVFSNGEQKNETSDISRSTSNAGADLSYRVSGSAYLTARYTYYDQRSGDLGDAAQALRVANNLSEAETLHQHVLNPNETRQTGELAARFSPITALDLDAHVRYVTLERYALLKKVGTDFVDKSDMTKSTLAGLSGRYRVSPELSFDGSFGREWTDGVVYAVETTGVNRYGLGASWTPAPVFMIRASWEGFRGENNDQAALQYAYPAVPPDTGSSPKRTVSGDAFMAMATYMPAPAFNLTASWSLTDNGVKQDMLFGSAAEPAFSFASPDTSWSGRSQIADLRARWELTKRVALTVDGMWIDSLESYTPTFPLGAGLKEISTVDFTKLLASFQAEVRLIDSLGLTFAAFWTRYDDQVDNAGDGTAQGVLAALDYRW